MIQGMKVNQILLDKLGIITGSIDLIKIDSLQNIKGVLYRTRARVLL